MTVINSQITYNWSNKESDTRVQKRICLHLEEISADPTSKTLHLGNSKSKATSVQGLHKFLLMFVSIFKDIITTRNEQKRCHNKQCTARPRTFWKNAWLR